MKVHRKILVHYLSCPSPVDKEGYLFKKKERTGAFHRRWFVLKGNLLFYQERPADRHIGGAIVLEGCAVRTEDSDRDFSLVFEGLRTYRRDTELHLKRLHPDPPKTPQSGAGNKHEHISSTLKKNGIKIHPFSSVYPGTVAEVLPQRTARRLQSRVTSNQLRTSDLVLTPPPLSDPALPQATPPSAAATAAVTLRPLPRKSPKLWARRNAHVTPINGPAPLSSEWPDVDFNPLQEFQKIHEFYGREVLRARDEWERTREEGTRE
ncbi:sesquipedalian-1-like, partial [Boleophthalmus pectinirostris]|uniref:sesquipedalian-1-like n=1 Tax=Boleophthalmus pectinirostris TaxID=150288 RepID=UPI00242BD1E3